MHDQYEYGIKQYHGIYAHKHGIIMHVEKLNALRKTYLNLFFHLKSTSLNSNSGNEFLFSSVLNS